MVSDLIYTFSDGSRNTLCGTFINSTTAFEISEIRNLYSMKDIADILAMNKTFIDETSLSKSNINNKQILYVFLFNIRNYTPEVINI